MVPKPSRVWDYGTSGIKGGGVAAVIHGDKVAYAVVGDTGPKDTIGEASYATAKALGMDPDPRTGGAESDVTYILFKDSEAIPIESTARRCRWATSWRSASLPTTDESSTPGDRAARGVGRSR